MSGAGRTVVEFVRRHAGGIRSVQGSLSTALEHSAEFIRQTKQTENQQTQKRIDELHKQIKRVEVGYTSGVYETPERAKEEKDRIRQEIKDLRGQLDNEEERLALDLIQLNSELKKGKLLVKPSTLMVKAQNSSNNKCGGGEGSRRQLFICARSKFVHGVPRLVCI